MLIVVLFNILEPLGWKIGLLRLEDVAAGAAVGVAIGLLIWPRGASGSAQGGAGGPARLPAPGRAQEPGLAEVWSAILIAGHRLWYSADVMGRMQAPDDASCPCSEFVGTLQHYATRLSDAYGEVSRALRSGTPVRGVDSRTIITRHLATHATSCALTMEGSSQPAELMSGVHLFEVRSWLLELSDDLRQLDELVLSLGPVPQAADAGKEADHQLLASSEPTRI